ncbi:MAG TPA: PQQ-dependent sugar dehydrogenase [Pirellulales bacterium]|jgi:glucose/arabinose dehydrogenase|nr:PQQ-dependent sugar dehydrogenase [Pirellulales bacterium]
MRGAFFGCAAVLLLAATATTALALTSPVVKGSISIKLNLVATVPSAQGAPQDLVSANDGTGRLFVTTRNGDVDILKGGALNSAMPFLNLPADGISVYTGGEGGFSGLAFSPSFTTNGKFYTFDTEPFSSANPATAGFSSPELLPNGTTTPNNQILIREWTVSTTTPDFANATSRILLRINHPEDNHQGGSLKFGPDGNLYIGLGDGGGNDFNVSVTSATDGHNNTIGNGQDTTVPFGKILRIDPNGTNSANGQYGIPSTNPFASGAGGNLKEIYAYGFRNPYRFSFDSATGALWVGDVGQSNREEIDTVTGGGNYGWPFREGTRDNSGSNGSGRTTPGGFTSIAPVGEYTHGDGEAIIGGFVYHGSLIPALQGKYVFGDLGGTSGATGRMFYMDTTTGAISEFNYLGSTVPTSNLYGYGQDSNGELYALFSNGNIVALVPEPSSFVLLVLATAASFVALRQRQLQKSLRKVAC